MSIVSAIPPRIIQTARSRNLPPLARAAAANLKLLHPGWDYLFFDDSEVERFVRGTFPQYSAVYDSFPRRIQKFDFFRYLAVLHFGGFYFDLDVLLSEPLSPLLGHSCVFPFEELTLNGYLRDQHGTDWEIGNYAFGACAGHPFLAAVVESCVRAQKDTAWTASMMESIPRPFRSEFLVLNTTGPGLITRTLVENPAIGRLVTVLHPDDVCDSRNWHQFGRFGIHLMEGSWRSGGNFLWRKVAQLWENRCRARLLKESRARGHTRTHLAPQLT